MFVFGFWRGFERIPNERKSPSDSIRMQSKARKYNDVKLNIVGNPFIGNFDGLYLIYSHMYELRITYHVHTI